MKEKITIGRIEKASFPDLGIGNIDVKIDTGAYSSALHCHQIKVNLENDLEVLSFKLLDPSHPEYKNKVFNTKDFTESRVKSSSGQVEDRYKIKTTIEFAGKHYLSEFTLTNRKDMKFPVLIGRKLLSKRFLVDVAKKYLTNK